MMKRFALLCVFLLFVHYSMQIPKYENCLSEVLPTNDRQRCVKVTCISGNNYVLEECSKCNDKNKGLYRGEHYSEYPACCPPCIWMAKKH